MVDLRQGVPLTMLHAVFTFNAYCGLNLTPTYAVFTVPVDSKPLTEPMTDLANVPDTGSN